MEYFLNPTEKILREIKKDIIENLLYDLNLLIKRCYSIGEKNEVY